MQGREEKYEIELQKGGMERSSGRERGRDVDKFMKYYVNVTLINCLLLPTFFSSLTVSVGGSVGGSKNNACNI